MKIPEDIRKKVSRLWHESNYDPYGFDLEKLITEERERCFKVISDQYMVRFTYPDGTVDENRLREILGLEASK